MREDNYSVVTRDIVIPNLIRDPGTLSPDTEMSSAWQILETTELLLVRIL